MDGGRNPFSQATAALRRAVARLHQASRAKVGIWTVEAIDWKTAECKQDVDADSNITDVASQAGQQQ